MTLAYVGLGDGNTIVASDKLDGPYEEVGHVSDIPKAVEGVKAMGAIGTFQTMHLTKRVLRLPNHIYRSISDGVSV